MVKIFFITLLVGGNFLIFGDVLAVNSDIVINEIGAYEASGFEWVEIYNKGSEAVDLSGWKFFEDNTNHGLTIAAGDAVVSPGEYAVIAQDAAKFLSKYSGAVGSVFDSSWGSLNESGESIGLKDGAGNFVEQFTYISAPDRSLERKNPALADYSAANWQEHASGNTVGAQNSNFGSVAPPPPPPESGDASQATAPPTVNSEAMPPADWKDIKINEIVSSPASGAEWVELFNNSESSLDLSGGLICDSRGTTSTCKILSGAIGASGWLKADLRSESFLNNDGDAVILKNPEGKIVDMAVYGEGHLPAPEKGESLARKTDGKDSDKDSDWGLSSRPTPDGANLIVAPARASETASLGASKTSSAPAKNSSVISYVLEGDGEEQEKTASEVRPNVSSTTPAEKITNKNTVSSSASRGLAALREANKGQRAIVRGVVSVLPGIFGTQYFYISDDGGGIQVYQYKKDFPPLAVGDKVEIKGEISLAQGVKRLKVKSADDIDVLATEQSVSSSTLSAEELSEEFLGTVVRVSGDITEIKTNFMYLDDGASEAVVYFKRGAKIDKQKFKEGDAVEVAGILEQGREGFQIWPRSSDDIISLGLSEDVLKEQAALEEAGKTGRLEKYLVASVGGFSTLILAMLARARGVLILGGLKKVAGLAIRIIKKG